MFDNVERLTLNVLPLQRFLQLTPSLLIGFVGESALLAMTDGMT